MSTPPDPWDPQISLFDPEDIDQLLRDYVEYDEPIEAQKEVVCGCGAEKTYGKNTTHIWYCPKYEKVPNL